MRQRYGDMVRLIERWLRPGLLAGVLGSAACFQLMNASAATLEGALGSFARHIESPDNRCHWVMSRYADLDTRVSLNRFNASRWQVRVNGRMQKSSPTFVQLQFDTRTLGPPTLDMQTVAARSISQVRDGDRIEIGFTDGIGRYQPAFCGYAVLVETRNGVRRTHVVAQRAAPIRNRRTFTDMHAPDVIEELANEHGLQAETTIEADIPVRASTRQRNEHDWTFMRRIAREYNLSVVLNDADIVAVADSSFTPPRNLRAVFRMWREMSWVDIVQQLAEAAQITADVETEQSAPVLNLVRQNEDDLQFAAELARANRHSAFLQAGKLRVRDDGVWRDTSDRKLSARRTTTRALSDATDRVSHRVTIRWQASKRIAISRSVDDKKQVSELLLLNRGSNRGALAPVSLKRQPAQDDKLTRATGVAQRADSVATFRRSLGNVYEPVMNYIRRLP